MGLLLDAFKNKLPAPYVSPGQSQGRSLFQQGTSTFTAELSTMSSVGIINAIVSKTSQGVASAEWKLYKKPRGYSGNPEDRIEVTRHPALILLDKPNDFFTTQELFESVQQHLDLSGEGYVIVEYGDFAHIPIGLWYVRPDRMRPVESATEYLTGWIYKGPDGEEVPLDRDEVIQIRMPNPESYYRGLGPIKSVMNDISSSVASAEWNAKFFENSAQPGGVIELPTVASDTDFNRLRMQWRENHQGVSRAHRVAILENGAKFNNTSMSQKDMQFVELSNLSDEKIRQAFGFPKPMLGSVDDVNRANADAAEVVFGRWLLVPRLDRWKGALNNDYLPLFGSSTDNLEFDYCNPVPEDQEVANATLTAKTNAVAVLVAQGFDPEAACEAVGLPNILFKGKQVAAPTPPSTPLEEVNPNA